MNMNEDEFVSYVEFENEDGDTLTLQVVDYFEFEEQLYAILVNDEEYSEDTEDLEVCVLRVEETADGQNFVEPDESKIPDLQAIVEQIFAEEAEHCCEDDDCDCGHHHVH